MVFGRIPIQTLPTMISAAPFGVASWTERYGYLEADDETPVFSLGILAHRTSEDEQGVYNHRNETQGI